ncbi:MAG: hypothetical protein ACTSPI_14210, partial [Candidatus Heimdallarchaeaceae archaeon]
EYITTLKNYLSFNIQTLISGHDQLMNNTRLVEKNIAYLEELKQCKVNTKGFSEQQQRIHYMNLTRLAELYKNKGKKSDSLRYYEKALQLLDECESSLEIEKLCEQIDRIIKNLKT